MEYGLIGEHLSHSFSAEIHGKIRDYRYELKELKPEEVDGFMKEKNFRAINVTIPYKRTVIPYLSYIDPAARKIGAVNTVVNRNGELYGYNTDYSGMRELISSAGIDVSGKEVLILGSGGTSRTAYAVAESLDASGIYRVSRTGKDGCITYEEAKKNHGDARIIINTTPCGMYPNIGTAAVDIDDFPALSGVIDAVYNPLRTALVQKALDKGIPASGGLYMLVAQAVYAAEYFTGEPVEKGTTERIFREMLSNKENVVLIGMPGCGKSTVGKYLSSLRNMKVIDTDALIVQKEGKEITQIFAEVGESGFRDIESEVIREVSSLQHVIISTGGGSILRPENVALLKENGKTCFLDCPLSILKATDSRPLSNTQDKLRQRFEERYDKYCACADIRIECTDNFMDNAVMTGKEIENAYSGN